jgi:hypothetical protein
LPRLNGEILFKYFEKQAPFQGQSKGDDMTRIYLISTTILLFFMTSMTSAQQMLPAGAVVRTINCTIDEGFTFDEVVERARNLDRDDSSAQSVFMRRPIYTTAEYQENWDVQIAAYYPSYSEMLERRSAAGNTTGRLPLSCGNPSVVRAITGHQSQAYQDAQPDRSTMLTRFCSIRAGTNINHSYNRIKTASQSYADAGSDELVQMYIPGLGGPQNPGYDFILAEVGSSMEKIHERLDLTREGLRLVTSSNSTSPFSCNRPALWTTTAIYRSND